MLKSQVSEQLPANAKSNSTFPLKNSTSELISSTNQSIQFENYYSKADSLFGAMTYHDKSETQIEASIDHIRKLIKQIEQVIDKKIDKYYPKLRETGLEKEHTLEEIIEGLKNEKQLRNELINFQEIQIKDIQELEKVFDSKENIEFAIPIEIIDIKKKILDLEKFIHIAQIRQKKKSEDVVKIEKINNQQFEKIAMLRTTLEVEMMHQLTLNDREMKIDDKLYDFQGKIDTLNEKLARLTKIVEEKHILVSSNRGLIMLKEQKIAFDKAREETNKKIALLRNTIRISEQTTKRDIETMKKQILEKQSRYVLIEKEVEELKKKNDSYLIDATVNKNLRKSISYTYAETLLKVKQKERLENPQVKMKMNLSLLNESQSMKPNFKVKKMRNQVHSSVSKMNSSKKNVINVTLGEALLPITLDKPSDANENSSFYEYKRKSSQRNKAKSIEKVSEGLEEQIIIDD